MSDESAGLILIHCSSCQRTQPIVENDDEPGGATLHEAKLFGWHKVNGRWFCPFHNECPTKKQPTLRAVK